MMKRQVRSCLMPSEGAWNMLGYLVGYGRFGRYLLMERARRDTTQLKQFGLIVPR